MEYDNVLSQQREKIYRLRDNVLAVKDCYEITEKFYETASEELINNSSDFIEKEFVVDIPRLIANIENKYTGPNTISKELFYGLENTRDIALKVKEILISGAEKRKELWGEEAYNVILKSILLRCIDMNWPAHIDQMTKLRDGIHLRAYSNVNPLVQYQNEGFEMFQKMMDKIATEVVLYTLKVEVTFTKKEPTNQEENKETKEDHESKK